MKELLIFLLLIFFIEVKTKNLRPSPGTKIIKTSKVIPCSGGRVVSGVCKCPNGKKNYGGKCLKKAPIICRGGSISNNICICPKGTKLKGGKCAKVLTRQR